MHTCLYANNREIDGGKVILKFCTSVRIAQCGALKKNNKNNCLFQKNSTFEHHFQSKAHNLWEDYGWENQSLHQFSREKIRPTTLLEPPPQTFGES